MTSRKPRSSHRRDNSKGSNETIKATINTGTQRHDPFRSSKTCSLWVHDENYSKEDVLLDLDFLGKDVLHEGDLVEVTAASTHPETRDFQIHFDSASKNETTASGILGTIGQDRPSSEGLHSSKHSARAERLKEHYADASRNKGTFIFVAKPVPEDIKSRTAGVQISLKTTIASAFGFRNGDQVTVSLADQQEHTASHVEIVFRDIYLSRADMWRLVLSELCDQTIYKGQKLLFLGTIKATVKTIYAHGTRVASAYFSKSTIPIYRSESARYVLFIQMSREMWNFDSEGTGEILFSRVIDGFLPDLFKRWQSLDAKHLVSIVMFARLEYDYHQLVSLGQLHSAELKQSQFDSGRTKYRDFYRVVVSDMSSGQWTLILNALKKEFRVFLRDISVQETTYLHPPQGNKAEAGAVGKPRIAGRPSLALRGNILEAINIAASQFGRDYIDRDLVRTGISVIVITPGPGVFEVDRELLHLTSENVTNNGMGIDLVCLSKMPLHSVPLFKYRPPRPTNRVHVGMDGLHPEGVTSSRPLPGSLNLPRLGASPSNNMLSSTPKSPSTAWRINHDATNWLYGIPQWIDVSFWSSDATNKEVWDTRRATYLDTKFTKSFVPQVRMYELQMMGVTEAGLANISIPYLSEGPQGLQRLSRHVNPKRNLVLKPSKRHLGALSSSQRSQPAYLDHGESPQSTRKGVKALIVAHNRTNKHKLERMDEYDSHVFEAQRSRRWVESRMKFSKKQKQPDTAAPSQHRPKLVEIPSSSTITVSSQLAHQESAIAPAEEEKHRPVKPSAKPVVAPVQRPGGGRIARSISYALRGLGTAPPRATASTSINVENISAAGMTKGDRNSKGFAESVRIKSPDNQRQKAVDRMSVDSERSDNSDTSRTMSQRPQSPSRPISIKRTGRNVGHSHRLSQEVHNSFSTSTTKVDGERDGVAAATHTRESTSHSPEREHLGILTQHHLWDVSPWIKNVNPSNPKKNDPNATLSFGRWQHVFPRAPRSNTIKWRSLCTPASVPLTTEPFPTRHELENDYVQTPYTIHQETDSDLREVPKTRETLVSELIGLRLSHGYQLVVGPALADATGIEVADAGQLCDLSRVVRDGNVLYMSMGNTIQKLAFSDGKDVHVTKYVRKASKEKKAMHIDYAPSIKTVLSSTYSVRHFRIGGYNEEYPWSHADAYLAGHKGWHADLAEHLRFWRARFVLIPVDPPANARRGMQIMGHDTAEEIHLTGIKILSQMWQKYRYIPAQDRVVKLAVGKRKDPNPLDIMFQTRNPSEVVVGELDKLLELEENAEARPLQLLPDSDLFQRDRFALPALAQAIQGERGVEIVTRRWHLRLHYNCFTGTDLTTWLLQNFKDVETREEAVDLGNKLMDRKLFNHVEQRHNFRDGNYFYQIAPEYRMPRADMKSSWFSGKKPDRSVPATPMAESVSRDSPMSARSRSDSSVNLEAMARGSPSAPLTKISKPRHSISLSKVMRVNVDFRSRSNRPEIIDLHYDRLHNPENCYHIELNWLNVTSKLVEDAIVQWATTSEKYGLKLVEVPIDEISSVSDREPFRTPYNIYLSHPPPDLEPAPTYFNATSLSPQHGIPDRHYYQKQILKKFNFVLDLEAASNFPSDVDVTYSWGKLDYRYSQFVHRSGILLCQIADDGHFVIVANRLYNTRSAYSKDAPKAEGVFTRQDAQHFHRRPAPSAHPSQLHTATLSTMGPVGHPSPQPMQNPLSPHPSPLVRATSDVIGGRDKLTASARESHVIIPEDIKDELEAFCADPSVLEKFYDSITLPGQTTGVSSTGGRGADRLASLTPSITEERPDSDGGLEASIPSLVLPASVVATPMVSQQRKASLQDTSPPNNSNPHVSRQYSRDLASSPLGPKDSLNRLQAATTFRSPFGPQAGEPVSISSTSLKQTPNPSPIPSSVTEDAATTAAALSSSPQAANQQQQRRGSHFPPSPAISAISAAIEASPQLFGRDNPHQQNSPLRKDSTSTANGEGM